MRLFKILIFFIALQIPQFLEAQVIPSFEISLDEPVKVPEDQKYTFGFLNVPENRSDNASIGIKIPVYIFKSRNQNSNKDPIIYTVGGPGSSSMNAAQYMNYYKYLDDRDFIIFEQRGTFYAKPSLNCPEWGETNEDYSSVQAVKECRDRLRNEGIDLDGYRTTEIAADMEDLRKLLEIEQWNLLTISYSTKIAQVMMREYPESIRSVILDSPLPLESSYDEESAKNLMEVLNRIFDDCESQIVCNEQFPNLKNRFFKFLVETNKLPKALSVDDSVNTINYNGTDLALLLLGLSQEQSKSIPLFVKTVLDGDYSLLLNKDDNSGSYSDGIGVGVRLSVWCAEEFPFASQKIIEKESNFYPEIHGYNPEVFSKEICVNWNVTPELNKENKAIQSKIPTLIISGSYDHVTPLSWAMKMNKNLSNSFLLVFNGWKHTPTTNWGNSCAMNAANQFFNNPGSLPTSECIETAKSVKFISE